jgi:hypothetical protein
MSGRKSVTPLIETSAKKPPNLFRALSPLLLLVMLLNPIETLRASASYTPQYASKAISRATLSDIGNLSHPLDLESRMICRQAVEEVYWQHRIWPAENQSPKPDLDQVLLPQVLRARVEDDLRRSNALALLWPSCTGLLIIYRDIAHLAFHLDLQIRSCVAQYMIDDHGCPFQFVMASDHSFIISVGTTM